MEASDTVVAVTSIVTALVAVASLVATVLLWALGRTRKGLGYEILEIEPLVQRTHPLANQLEVRFKARVFADPYIVKVRICNAERAHIRATDFLRPITVTFGSEVVPLGDSKYRPTTLPVVEDWSTNGQLTIEPLSMNVGAEIIVVALADKRLEETAIECHTLLEDAVHAGDARRLAQGPTALIKWLRSKEHWLIWSFIAMCILLFLLVPRNHFEAAGMGLHQMLSGQFEQRHIEMLPYLLLGGLSGLGLAWTAGYIAGKLSDRGKWPDFLR